MLKQRVLTALVLLPIVFYSLLGPYVLAFTLLSGLLVLVAAWEWSTLMQWHHAGARVAYVGTLALILMGLRLGHLDQSLPVVRLICTVSGLIWVLMLGQVARYPESLFWRTPVVMPLLGLWLLVPTWMGLNLLKVHAMPALWVLFVLVWGADTGAYFSGRTWGRHKLAPSVSPGKSIEGLLGGLLLTSVFMVLVLLHQHMGLLRMSAWWLWGVLTVLASVLGDLLESMAKRACGLKDSGRIFPGHGGALDRIDSLTAAVPVFVVGWFWLGGL